MSDPAAKKTPEKLTAKGNPKQQIQRKRAAVKPPHDIRRTITGVLALVLFACGAVGRFALVGGNDSSIVFTDAGMRIGLVLGGLWLAWDSLRRPARWLPPGLAVAGVIGIAVIAAQPKMLIAVLPAFGVLVTIGGLVRAFRGRDQSS